MWMIITSHYPEKVMIIGKLISIAYRVCIFPTNGAGYLRSSDNGLESYFFLFVNY